MPGSHISKYCTMSWERISSIGSADVRRWCLQRIPILNWAPSYSLRDNLFPDFISGLMLTVQQVAQGLAFAIMSSVHPVFGLYSSLFPPLIYAIFGTSHHVSTVTFVYSVNTFFFYAGLGYGGWVSKRIGFVRMDEQSYLILHFPRTFAITSLISAGAVERLVSSNNDSATNGTLGVLSLSDFEMQRIGVAAAVTFLAGIIQISMFLLHLGGATCILSEPVVSSMTTGAATHVVTSQVKYLLGMEMPYISGPLGMFYIYGYILSNINMVQTKVLLFSILCIVILVLVKELNERFRNKIKMIIPVDLVLIITTSLACYFADMENVYGIKIVGPLPKGIPSPQVPPMGVLSDVVTEAFSVALVGYTVSIFLANNSAKKFKYTVDENQELLAHGLSNIIPSFLLCIPNAAAPARTFLLYNNGAKTQVACLISCTMVLLVIYFIVPLLYWLPLCVLASITVVALKGMLIQFRDLKKYWNVDKMDWVIWIFTYLVTICFAANIGLLFGVVFNISLVIFRLTRGKTLHFIQVDDNCIRMSVNVQSESNLNAKVISMRKPLFFLNAQKFHDEIMKINEYVHEQKASLLLNSWTDEDCNGKASVSQLQTNERSSLILDCSGITFFDFTGAAALAQICLELDQYDTDVLLASCNVALVKALKYSGFGIEHLLFFDSVQSAFNALQIKENDTSLEGIYSSDV